MVLDAGHGGSDWGATRGALHEKDITLAVVQTAFAALHKSAPHLYTFATRLDDYQLNLPQRARIEHAIANAFHASLFISVHVNSTSQSETTASGVAVFHFPGSVRGAALAATLLDRIRKAVPSLPQYNVGVIPAEGGFKRPRWILENTKSPAALVELGFVNNPADAALLADPSRQAAIAAAIAAAAGDAAQAA